jgi:hypothetical protein
LRVLSARLREILGKISCVRRNTAGGNIKEGARQKMSFEGYLKRVKKALPPALRSTSR